MQINQTLVHVDYILDCYHMYIYLEIEFIKRIRVLCNLSWRQCKLFLKDEMVWIKGTIIIHSLFKNSTFRIIFISPSRQAIWHIWSVVLTKYHFYYIILNLIWLKLLEKKCFNVIKGIKEKNVKYFFK